jgi:hypothetical protein
MYFGQIERSCLDGDLWSLYQTSPLPGYRMSVEEDSSTWVIPNCEPARMSSKKVSDRPLKSNLTIYSLDEIVRIQNV